VPIHSPLRPLAPETVAQIQARLLLVTAACSMKRRATPAAQSKSKKSKTTPSTSSAAASPLAPRIVWPVLSPVSPYLELQVQETPGLALVPNLLGARDCASIIALFNDSRNPLLQPPRPPAKDEASRSNWRWTGNEQDFATVLWHRFADTARLMIGEDNDEQSRKDSILDDLEGPPGTKPVGLNPDIRVYRYEAGQSFGKHYDDSVAVNGQRTEWCVDIVFRGYTTAGADQGP